MDEREAHSWVWSAAEELLISDEPEGGQGLVSQYPFHGLLRISRDEAEYPAECPVSIYGEGERVTTPATNSDINTLTPMP